MPLSVALVAGALAAATALPVGAPVETRTPDFAREIREFEVDPPAWSADVVVAVDAGGMNGQRERLEGWFAKPENWELVDYVDRAYNYSTHGWLGRRGIAVEHYGFNEYQESFGFRTEKAIELFGERGLARGPMGELVIDPLFSLPVRHYITDPVEPRWSAVLAYDMATSPLLGDAVSQDNIGAVAGGVGPSSVGMFGDASARGFAAWRRAKGEPEIPPIREYLRARHLANVASLEPYVPTGRYDFGRGSAAGQSLCADPVLADYKVFRFAANLGVWARIYKQLHRIAARAGRPFDVHGNLGGGPLGFDAYPFALAPFVDTIWFEVSGLSQFDQIRYGRLNAWGALRLELARAAAGDRTLMFQANPEKKTPDLETLELAEVSAGGGIPLVNPDMLVTQAPGAMKAYEDVMRLRDRHRAVFGARGRTRIAEVALLYSLPTVMFDPCVLGASSTDTAPLNDFSGAARALEDGHVAYEVVTLPHPELAPKSLPVTDLARYRVVIAPSVANLSDADIERLTRYLRGGGTLAVTGVLGVRDERNRARAGDALAKLRAAGRVQVLIQGAGFPGSRNGPSPETRALGARFAAELARLLPDPIVTGALAPTTWVKLWRHAGGFASAHFVSYSADWVSGAARTTAPAAVRLRLPGEVRAEKATWLVPGEAERELPLRVTGHTADVTLPALRVYGVLVVGPAGAEARASALARGEQRLARTRRANEGAPGLEPRLARVTALRAADPAGYDAAAGALLRAVSAERDAAYLAWVGEMADFGDPVAAFSFGRRTDLPPWRGVSEHTSYSKSLGFGWLPADDDSLPSPEEKDYGSAIGVVDSDQLYGATLYYTYWPYAEATLPKPLAFGVNSGRPRTFRVELPDGGYRVSVVVAMGMWTQLNFLVSGMVTANGRPVLLDVPMDKGSIVRRSFGARVTDGKLDLRFGGPTGFTIVAVVIEEASHWEPDPLEAGAVRAWRVSPRHPNPDWAPLSDLVVPRSEAVTEVRAAAEGIPLVDLGSLRQAEIGDVVVARAELERSGAGKAELHVGASSAARVYLNGELVLDLPNVKGVERDEGVAQVALRAGTNQLEVVLSRFWERRWLFFASVSPERRAE